MTMGSRKNKLHYMALFVLESISIVSITTTTASELLILGSPPMKSTKQEYKPDCRHNQIHSMLQARCHDTITANIPRYLNRDIEILDASFNIVQKLRNDSLSPYRKLIYIYLDNNVIQNIEEFAFAQQYYLEVLDLTNNALENVPKSLFQLPNLRTLHLSSNHLNDSAVKIDSVTSPLTFLQLDNNQLTRLPEMGYMPSLTHLNVSKNMITKITTEELARFCRLRSLDGSRNLYRGKRNTCECVVLAAWIKLRGIDFKPAFQCMEPTIKSCGNIKFSNVTLTVYEECMTMLEIQEQTEKTRWTWILVASAISSFIGFLFLVLCFIHRRNKKK